MSEANEVPITLRPVTADTVVAISKLSVAPEQQHFVAPNALSMAQAYFASNAWFRAIYAGDRPVGFVMLAEEDEGRNFYLWRFMIDRAHQRRGYGRQAMELVIAHVRAQPAARAMTLSYVPGEGSPAPFYAGLGFVETGEMDGIERVMRRGL